MLAIEERPMSVLRVPRGEHRRKLGRKQLRGVHFEEADEITIEGESSQRHPRRRNVPRRAQARPINLRPAQPLSFVKLAA